MIVSLWFGSAAFLLFVAAPAAFRASDSSTNAANVVGSMLGGWHYIALVAPLVLLAIEWRRARGAVIAVVFAGVLFAAAEAAIDLQIRALRASSPVPITALEKSDPLRRRFGMLHGISSLALVVQLIIAAAATIAIESDSSLSS